jgi:hypothetical protein
MPQASKPWRLRTAEDAGRQADHAAGEWPLSGRLEGIVWLLPRVTRRSAALQTGDRAATISGCSAWSSSRGAVPATAENRGFDGLTPPQQ